MTTGRRGVLTERRRASPQVSARSRHATPGLGLDRKRPGQGKASRVRAAHRTARHYRAILQDRLDTIHHLRKTSTHGATGPDPKARYALRPGHGRRAPRPRRDWVSKNTTRRLPRGRTQPEPRQPATTWAPGTETKRAFPPDSLQTGARIAIEAIHRSPPGQDRFRITSEHPLCLIFQGFTVTYLQKTQDDRDFFCPRDAPILIIHQETEDW